MLARFETNCTASFPAAKDALPELHGVSATEIFEVEIPLQRPLQELQA